MRPMSILVSALALSAVATVRTQDPRTTAVRDAQRLAHCMITLDTACVVALSDVAGFDRLASPLARRHWDFVEAQQGWFDGLKRVGASYTQFDVSRHPEVFSIHGRMYAFVPYRQTLTWPGHPVRPQACYFIGVSGNGGLSWKFVDGRAVTQRNAHLIIGGYQGNPPLPPVDRSAAVGSPPHGTGPISSSVLQGQ